MIGCGWCEAPGVSCVIEVAAVDDHPLILRGVQAYLAGQTPCIRVTVVAPTVDKLLAETQQGVSVVLLDLHLGDGTTAEDNVRRIRQTGSQVVLYTSEHRPVVVRRALEAGAIGLILKEEPEACLVEAIRQAQEGQFYVSSHLAYQVVADPDSVVRLSKRETEVLTALARGLPWDTLARHLKIEVSTARTHCNRAMRKYADSLGGAVNGNKDLVYRAIADGHVEMPPPPVPPPMPIHRP